MTKSISELGLKASELTLEHFNHIYAKPNMGLKDLRLTLNSIDAWGLLRKDLITALGVERAKRFLLRYGYHCGVHEARIYKKAFHWKNDLEWLIAGTKAHDLFGRVFSYPESFQVDMEKGFFNVSGYWIDSFEAKQHLQNFSEHHEPICYYLVGYASGYNSECLGKKVIFKEVRCKGKGDDHCSYTGKTVEEWGKDVTEEELMYFEDEDMSDELDKMYQKVEQQKAMLELNYSISRQMTQSMLQGEGFAAFVEIIGKNLRTQVIISDRHFKVLASYGDVIGKENWLKEIDISAERMETHPVNTVIETNLRGKTFKLLTAPVMVKKQVYGFITITLTSDTDKFHKDVLERVATITALHMQNERVAIETEQRLKGEMLEHLLNDKDANLVEIFNRFSYLGYNLTEPHYIFHIEIQNNQKEEKLTYNHSEYLEVRNKIKSVIYQDTSNKMDIPILPKLNTIQMIISKQLIDKKKITIEQFGEQLLDYIDGHNYQVYIGISNKTTELSDFHIKAVEAKKTVEFAKIRYAQSRVIFTDQLGYSTLFLNVREPEQLELFSSKKLKPIIDYDKKKDAELLMSLFYYSQHEFNLHKTAREMSISISGMKYRIKKIEELLELDLSNSNNRFEIQLSLQILLVLGKIKD